jgi:hypothetical protein
MIQRDFIMVQIEELGKVIARMIDHRNANAARKNPELVQVVYNSLGMDLLFLSDHSPEEILQRLNGEDRAGLPRMEIAAKLLMEEAWLHPEKQTEYRHKAKELLEYIHRHDTTFSLERIQLLDELSTYLSS